MFCEKCGEKLVAGAQFCPSCGTKIGESAATVPLEATVSKRKVYGYISLSAYLLALLLLFLSGSSNNITLGVLGDVLLVIGAIASFYWASERKESKNVGWWVIVVLSTLILSALVIAFFYGLFQGLTN